MNANCTYSISEDVSLVFGVEYRVEEFTIGAVDEASSTAGTLGDQGYSLSSNGFPGFFKTIDGVFDLSNYSTYIEAEWDTSDDLLVTAALRFEDFGTTTNYKLGFNYHLNDDVGIRVTYSTGFKAPTSGRSNASDVSTVIDDITGKLVNKGTIRATSPVVLLYGSKVLELGSSTNVIFGVYVTVGAFDITLDWFDIDVEDRLNLSKDVDLSAADIAKLKADNVPAAGDMSQFRFLINDFDTNTNGIDLVISTSTDWFGGTTAWNLAYNKTTTAITNCGNTIDAERERSLEDMTPDTR